MSQQPDTRRSDVPQTPRVDAAGRPVETVRKDIERPNPATETIDKVITPTSIKAREQETEQLKRQSEALHRQTRD